MTQPHMKAITLPPARARVAVLDAARVGSTDTSVLRFSLANVSVIGTAIAVATTAAGGTTFTIRQRGTYFASLIGFTADADGTAFGVSKNGSGVTLTGVPVLGNPGMLEAATILPVIGQVPTFKLGLAFEVTSAEADAVAGAVIRFHATDDGGTPPGEITLGSVLATVFRTGDYEG